MSRRLWWPPNKVAFPIPLAGFLNGSLMANLPALPTSQRMFSKWESVCNDLVSYTNTPALTDEKRAILSADMESLRRKLEPAGAEELTKAIAKLSMGCKHGAGDGLDRKAFIAILMEHAMGYPIDIIREACYEWTHGHTFFPSIAEFCGLCEPKFQKRRGLFAAMQHAAQASDQKRQEQESEAKRKREMLDPNKRAAVEARISEARANLEMARMRPARKTTYVALPDDERERLLQKLGSR